jgi:hypothetical protein
MMSVSSVCLIVLIAVGHVMAAYRSLSGVGNNEVNLLWGASGSPLSSDGNLLPSTRLGFLYWSRALLSCGVVSSH